MMNSLSVTIITFNEEIMIGRCLESVLEIADEIVIVDSFSNDATETICKKFNVKFVQHPFEGHIQQKNYALSLTSYPRVLSLDADEVLSPELINSIKQVKDNWTHDGYYFNRLNNYCGKWIKHGGWYPDQKLRLFDKSKGSWGGTNPHDKVIMQKKATKKYIKGDLLHYTCSSISQHVQQIDKFSEIGALQLFRENKDASIFKILSSPLMLVFKHYFIKLGFLDGFYGFVIVVISAHAKFLRYTKLRVLNKQNNTIHKST